MDVDSPPRWSGSISLYTALQWSHVLMDVDSGVDDGT